MIIPPRNSKQTTPLHDESESTSISKQTINFLGAEETPLTQPTKYVTYGSGPYKLLSFAKFRGEKTFTVLDYREFCLNAMNPKRIDASLTTLAKCGYIAKFSAPHDRENPNVKYMYQITLSGEYALICLGRKRREQREAEQRRIGFMNGQLGLQVKKHQQPPLI